MMLSGIEEAIERSRLRPEEHTVQLGIRPLDHSQLRLRHGGIQSQMADKIATLTLFFVHLRLGLLHQRLLSG